MSPASSQALHQEVHICLVPLETRNWLLHVEDFIAPLPILIPSIQLSKFVDYTLQCIKLPALPTSGDHATMEPMEMGPVTAIADSTSGFQGNGVACYLINAHFWWYRFGVGEEQQQNKTTTKKKKKTQMSQSN